MDGLSSRRTFVGIIGSLTGTVITSGCLGNQGGGGNTAPASDAIRLSIPNFTTENNTKTQELSDENNVSNGVSIDELEWEIADQSGTETIETEVASNERSTIGEVSFNDELSAWSTFSDFHLVAKSGGNTIGETQTYLNTDYNPVRQQPLDEAALSSLPHISVPERGLFSQKDGYTGEGDFGANIWFSWDGNGLSIRQERSDDSFTSSDAITYRFASGSEGQIQAYAVRNTRNDASFIRITTENGTPSAEAVEGVEIESSSNDGKQVTTIEVPWEEFKYLRPTNQDVKIMVVVGDVDEDGDPAVAGLGNTFLGGETAQYLPIQFEE